MPLILHETFLSILIGWEARAKIPALLPPLTPADCQSPRVHISPFIPFPSISSSHAQEKSFLLEMPLPSLAPSSARSVTPCLVKQQQHHQRVPTPEDWEAAYSEIERLYFRERRKLRHVMEYMEQVHSFKAT